MILFLVYAKPIKLKKLRRLKPIKAKKGIIQ